MCNDTSKETFFEFKIISQYNYNTTSYVTSIAWKQNSKKSNRLVVINKYSATVLFLMDSPKANIICLE